MSLSKIVSCNIFKFSSVNINHNIRNFLRASTSTNLIKCLLQNYTTSVAESQKINDKSDHEKVIKTIRKDTAVDIVAKKLFAVIHIAGSQYKVTNNDVIMINKTIEAECGDKIRFEKVLAVGGRNFTFLGQPLLKQELINVEGTVIEKTKGEKVIAFKKKKRKGYKKWKGHRQELSVIKINSIDFDVYNL